MKSFKMDWLSWFVVFVGSARSVLGVNLSNTVFLPDGYDFQTIPPSPDGGPLLVNFSIFLGGILAIDEPTQSISLECILRSHWKDSRIQTTKNASADLGYFVLNRSPTSSIWFPDVYVDSAKSIVVPSYVLTPEYLRIYPDRTLLYALKITLDLSCPMDFSNYPVDTQHCNILFESWSTVLTLVNFGWNETGSQIRDNLNLNQHFLEVNLCNRKPSFFETGVFPSIVMRLSLTRKLTYHLLRTYLPSLLFVTLGWLSMFIPVEHIPGRVGMGMTALLTVSSMFGATTSVTPPVSYATKLDFWMVGCVCFVFAVLLEFIVVITIKYQILARNESHERANNPVQVYPMSPDMKQKHDAWLDHGQKPTSNVNEDARRITRKVDKICIGIYFGVMIVFNIIYWLDIWMTNQKRAQDPKSEDTYGCFRLD